MAGFKMHIGTSTVCGIAYGTTANMVYDVPVPACVLAAGLCSVSGMLPDLDSGPGVPLRESVSFAAAVVPMLMIDRMEQMHLAPEWMVLCGGMMYLFIRFGVGRLLRKFTVHRGIFHSIPALAIVGELAYWICAQENFWMRCFNSVAVMIGFSSHLILDEIWSIDFKRLRLKSSFGTAIKFWSECWWANLVAYANVIVLALLITQDPLPNKDAPANQEAEAVATQPDDTTDSDDPWRR